MFDIRTATKQEMLDEFERRGGRGGSGWTRAERDVLFGDSSPRINRRDDDLVSRFQNGEYLTRSDMRDAKRIIRQRVAS